MSDRLDAILSQMTLQEKIDMLAGADMWTTVPNERLNIPALKVTDGPNGARGGDFGMGPSAACLPVGIAIGSTWNPELVKQLGRVLAEEAHTKGANILLAPTINTHRSLLNGRNFECYSEDPWLSSRLTVAYIEGLQENGVGACPKHFVANDSEHERYTTNSVVDERALREIYLPAFKAAVTEAKAWSIMSGYNKVNGTWCSESKRLLKDILKAEWGFDGIVISDWFGTYSSDIGTGGLDLEMPGPSRWAATLAGEVEAGRLEESEIDDKVSRILRTLDKAGKSDSPEIPAEYADDNPEHRTILRQAAVESIVLLKNDKDLLPLTADNGGTIALIGGNARWPGVMGGGSAIVPAHYVVTPLEGIQSRFKDQSEIRYEIGTATSQRMIPMISTGQIKTESGDLGIQVDYYDGPNLEGEPVGNKIFNRMSILIGGFVHEAVADQTSYSMRVKGIYTPEATGTHTFSLATLGLGRMMLDGELLIDNWSDFRPGGRLFDVAKGERRQTIELTEGVPVELVIEASSDGAGAMNTIRIGCLPPMPSDPIASAAKLASEADVAVVYVGTNNEWETEGFDQASVDLPGEQNALIEAVVAANPNTVVVLNTGTPKMMPWIDRVPAVLQTWFPGQEGGNAIADVLSGDVNPAGRLPQTFPKRAQDNPAHLNYPGENQEVRYGEGIFVGYRYYEHMRIDPLFAFGHGLSYTDFAYSNLQVSQAELMAGDTLDVTVDITNTGTVAGHEVVQLYLHDEISRLIRPQQELKAFAKVMLEPGETKTVTLPLTEASFSYYDPALAEWVAETGRFDIRVGAASDDIRCSASVQLNNPADQPTLDTSGSLHVGLPIGQLLATPAAQAVFGQLIPDLSRAPTMFFNSTQPLDRFSAENPHLIHPRLLARINQGLIEAAQGDA